jgi:hypothetical protein
MTMKQQSLANSSVFNIALFFAVNGSKNTFTTPSCCEQNLANRYQNLAPLHPTPKGLIQVHTVVSFNGTY